MLRFQLSNRYPDYLSKEKLHIITTRKTIFGIHQPMQDQDFDNACTRTHLVAFTKHDDAHNFKESLDRHQQIRKYMVDRVMDGSVDTYRQVGPLLPMDVDCINAVDMEMLARIHGFHLMVVHNVHSGDEPFQDIYECFLYETPLPAKKLLVKYFKDMYRKAI